MRWIETSTNRNLLRWTWIPVVATGMFLHSCELEGTMEACHFRGMDTTILSGTSFEYSFGYFGDEEGVEIILYPEHAQTCEILNEHWEERILRYVPEEGFIGLDTVDVRITRNYDGDLSLDDQVNFMIIFHVVQGEFQRALTGRWEWVRSCGGFAGSCWYPGEDNQKMVEFTPSMQYIETVSGIVAFDCPYTLSDSALSGETMVYKIEFGCRNRTFLWFAGETLAIQGGDFTEEFERIP